MPAIPSKGPRIRRARGNSAVFALLKELPGRRLAFRARPAASREMVPPGRSCDHSSRKGNKTMHMLIAVFVPLSILMFVAACDGAKPANGQSPNPQDAKSRPASGPAKSEGGKADFAVVKLETTEGAITLELNRKKAPKTVENFLSYVRKGFYDGTVFHRIKKDFMIQGGGFTEDLSQKPTDKPIENEADNGLSNDRGTIAMARTTDPHSATAQFFINDKDNAFLNHSGKNQRGWGYCVFGKVKDDASMKVVDTIREIPVVPSPMMQGEVSKPTKVVKITKATIISE
jgi:peptidyl-prolyl cis-trans isomerase B (cyclophilin B)